MENVIRSNKNLIITSEFCPSSLRKCGSDPKKFIDKITSYGFKINDIDVRKRRVKHINFSSLMNMCKGDKYTNLLFKR